MRRIPVLVLLLLLAAPAAAQASRFGAMLYGPRTLPQRIAALHALGVDVVRPSGGRLLAPTASDAPARLREAGFTLIETATNSAGAGPATPPTDLVAYRAALGALLARDRPAVVAIENEEQAPHFYAGTPADYLRELRAAVPVAHAHGVRVTNGGIVCPAVALATWRDLWVRGEHRRADAFAQRAFAIPGRGALRRVRADLPDRAHPRRAILAHQPGYRALLEEARTLIAGYRPTGIDYVNFHWYEADGWALRLAVAYLQRATGLRAMTNEIGQYDRSPVLVTDLVRQTARLGLPWVVWFAGDGQPAVSLLDLDGTLRPNGTAFRDAVAAAGG